MPLRILFLNPPSFENFDGGAVSRWPATREVESYWHPVWLVYPAGMLEGSRLLDAPPHGISADENSKLRADRHPNCNPRSLVPDPPALGDQPFPSGHGGQRPDDCSLLSVNRRFYAQYTESALVVVGESATPNGSSPIRRSWEPRLPSLSRFPIRNYSVCCSANLLAAHAKVPHWLTPEPREAAENKALSGWHDSCTLPNE